MCVHTGEQRTRMPPSRWLSILVVRLLVTWWTPAGLSINASRSLPLDIIHPVGEPLSERLYCASQQWVHNSYLMTRNWASVRTHQNLTESTLGTKRTRKSWLDYYQYASLLGMLRTMPSWNNRWLSACRNLSTQQKMGALSQYGSNDIEISLWWMKQSKVCSTTQNLGQSEHLQYFIFVLPHHSPGFTLKETVSKLTPIFGERTFLFNIRCNCLEIVRQPTEGIASIAGRFKKKYEPFQLKWITDDQSKMLDFCIRVDTSGRCWHL